MKTQKKSPMAMLSALPANAARRVSLDLVDKWNVLFLFFAAGWIIGWISHSYACTPWYHFIG